jgi:hypothetical protein
MAMAQSSSEAAGAQLTDRSGVACFALMEEVEAADRAGTACTELDGWESGLPPAARA